MSGKGKGGRFFTTTKKGEIAELQKDLVENASEISALLKRNEMQATLLGFTGTPGLLVGSYPIGGAMDLENLEKVVREARRLNKRGNN